MGESRKLERLFDRVCLDHRDSRPRLSIVIPIRDEEQNIAVLVEEIGRAFAGHALSDYEIIIVDDGSTDGTPEILRSLRFAIKNVRTIELGSPMGQSAAVCHGVLSARASWIATLDGDGQNDPADILKLWGVAQERAGEGASVLVIGDRIVRRDSAPRRVTSWVLRWLSAACLRHESVDKGSGLKVFRRDDFLALPKFDHMHRFLPGLFKLLDAEIISVRVNHRPRLSGDSHYKNLARIRQGLVDVAGIMWLQRRFILIPLIPDQEDDGATA